MDGFRLGAAEHINDDDNASITVPAEDAVASDGQNVYAVGDIAALGAWSGRVSLPANRTASSGSAVSPTLSDTCR